MLNPTSQAKTGEFGYPQDVQILYHSRSEPHSEHGNLQIYATGDLDMRIAKVGLLALALSLMVSCSSEEQQLYKNAQELQQDQQYIAAAALYQKIIKEAPDSKWATEAKSKMEQAVQSISGQGDTAMVARDYSKALNHYQKAAELAENPDQFKAKITEAQMKLNAGAANTPTEMSGELPPAATSKSAAAMSVQEVQAFVEQWRKAWENTASSKDLSAYKALYSPGFYSNYKKQDFQAWMAAKQTLANTTASLKIGVSELRWQPGRFNTIQIDFTQSYAAPGYSDLSKKTLILEQNGGQWQIMSEESETLEKNPAKPAPTAAPKVVAGPQHSPKEAFEGFLLAWQAREIHKMEVLMHNAYHGADGKNKVATLARLNKEAKATHDRTIDYQIKKTQINGDTATIDYLFNYYDHFHNGEEYSSCMAGVMQLKRWSDGKWYVFNESHMTADC